MTATKQLMIDWLDVLAKGEFSAWRDLVHDDIVFRFPYAPAGMPGEIRGSALAEETLKSWKSEGDFSWKDIVVYQSDDPAIVMATMSADTVFNDGFHYVNSSVVLTRFLGEKVIEHIEYFDPSPVAAALGI